MKPVLPRALPSLLQPILRAALGALSQNKAPLCFKLVPAKINKQKDLSPGKISSLMHLTRLEEGGNRCVSGWRQMEGGG